MTILLERLKGQKWVAEICREYPDKPGIVLPVAGQVKARININMRFNEGLSCD